jgi:hypothetical protein
LNTKENFNRKKNRNITFIYRIATYYTAVAMKVLDQNMKDCIHILRPIQYLKYFFSDVFPDISRSIVEWFDKSEIIAED